MSLLELIFFVIIPIIVTGIVSFYIGLYFRDRKRFLIEEKEITIVRNDFGYDKLKIMFGRKKIKELQYYSFKITNIGNMIISAEDLYNKNIQLIFADETEIFDFSVKVINGEEEFIQPNLNIENNTIILEFDCIETSGSFEVIVLLSNFHMPEINAEIKGGRVINVAEYSVRSVKRKITRLVLYAIFIIGLYILLSFLLSFIPWEELHPSYSPLAELIEAVVPLVSGVLITIFSIMAVPSFERWAHKKTRYYTNIH